MFELVERGPMPPLDGHLADLNAPPAPGGTPPFADAFLRHRAWLTAALAKRYGPDDAADLAQDTYVRIHGYVPAAPVRSPRSLLLRIALNLAANRFRKGAREIPTAANDDSFTQLRTLSAQEQAVFFRQMMLALPPKLRDVFVLSHVRGLTYREIAQLRGISVKAVEKRMHQALARCADAMRS